MSRAIAYGRWPSPIAAGEVATLAPTRDALHLNGDAVYWVESDPAGGHDRLVRAVRDSPPVELVQAELGVGSAVGGYGGGAYTVVNETVWFSASADGRLYRQAAAGTATPLTDASEGSYGDLRVTADRQWLLAVRERHLDGRSVSDLVAMPADGGEVTSLVSSGDLHASPELRPDARALAWTSWRHPDLPWQATQLWVASLTGARLGEPGLVAGGPGESVVQPRWSPEGVLHFVSDRSGWWNLYRWHDGSVEPVAVAEADMAPAPWELGYSSYAFLDNGTIAILLQRGGRTSLALHHPETGGLEELSLPYTSIKPYLAADGPRLALIGSTPSRTAAITRYDRTSGQVHEIASGRELADPRYIATPEPFDYPTRDGMFAHGLYFPPTNPDAVPQPGTSPPLIVRAHPGPTANTPVRLDPTVQFFTSRGYAVADVDYRGSTGYGRAYRENLNGRWGQLDVTDCVDAARHLAACGKASATQVVIRGASAGGYTALMAATTREFAAVTAWSAVIDPARWQQATTALQRHHAEALLSHPVDETHSILAQAARITAPVLLVHGDHDPVASIDDARALAHTLNAHGRACTLLVLPGTGHSITTETDVERALNAELEHYRHALDRARRR